MSFFSDLFEGHWKNLGTDLEHTFSSLASHPDELAETLGIGGLIAAPFLLPELGAAFGFSAASDLAGSAVADSIATDIGISDIAEAGAADFGAGTAAADFGAGTAADASAFDIGSATTGFNADPAITSYLDPSFAADAGAGIVPDVPAADFGADAVTPGSFESFNTGGGTFASDILGPASESVTGEGAPAWLSDPSFSSVTAPDAGTPGAGTSPFGESGIGKSAATDSWADFGSGGGGGGEPFAASGTGKGAAAGFTGSLSNVLSSPWTKLAVGAAPLALTLGMGAGQLPSAAQALQNQALTLESSGLTDLANARAGILNAGQTALIGQMSSNLKNQWLQTLYNQGVKDPTKDARWPQILGVIDQQVTAATAQLIQQNITNALAETGQASSALLSIANMQLRLDTNFTNALINAFKALGLMFGKL